MTKEISAIINESIKLKKLLLENDALLNDIHLISKDIISAFQNKNKVLFCGNGGSAADAQHLAAEFSGRFYIDREPLNAEALHVNTSYITAVANDYSFDEIYSRSVRAKGISGDILIGLSTSGTSKNVLKAFEAANKLGMICIGLCGNKPEEMKRKCKYVISIPSEDTARIQESHIMIGHIICNLVEKALF